jgi:Arylsulfatase A and related enzymes
MKTKKPLLIAGGLAALAGCAQKTPQQPNVIVILADDIGYGDLGCYGAIGVQTPNVDSIAAHGIRCTNAHAVASTSTPSRYALLTGQYPFRKAGTDVAAGNAGMIIDSSRYTIADMFKSQGYETCAIGKWHLGLGSKTAEQDWNGQLDQDLSDIGFDHHYIMAATADRVPCVFIEDGRVVGWDKDAPIEVSYEKNFEGEPTGKDNPELLYNLKSSHGHDYSIVNGIGRIGWMKGGGKALWKDENIADSITTRAVKFIEKNAGKPFFLYFCTNDVHVPRFPAERFRGASTMGLRGDAIAEFDWSVGQIRETLDRLGIADNTILVITSDNGPVLDDGYDDRAEELVGEHSPTGHLRGGKYSAFEGGTVIPLIVRWPERLSGGSVSGRLISQVDFYRSFANLLGAELPEGAAPDSKDFNEREYVIEMASSHTLSVRDSEWKYISPSKGPFMVPWGPNIEAGNRPYPQLYRINGDELETTDVAADHPEVVERFRKIVDEEAAKGGCVYPIGL